jgi:hypothetical protein
MKSPFLLFAKALICKSLIACFVLLFLQPANAQKVTPIARAGFGISDWRLSEGSAVQTGVLPALHLGIFAEVNLEDAFFVESGLEYSNAGAELKWDEYDSPNYSLGYLNLPVYGKVRLDNGLSFYAGPKVGFLLSANEKEEYGSKRDVKAAFKRADFSLVYGITYHLYNGIEVGLQLTHGLVNIYKDGDTQVRNNGLSIHAGYIIPMPKA